jgi:HNH endonuclease
MVKMKRCIYCREEKSADVFSEEHIVPQFLGGSSKCNAAVTRNVCQRCNSLFGRFVDAAVAKEFFMNGRESGAWQSCFDYNENSGNVFPLMYFGKCTELQCAEGEEAEVWLGPDGGTAWNFHKSRGEDFDVFAGGDPLVRRKDQSSRVYVFQASTVPYWLLSNLKSAQAHFKEEPIFVGADSDIEAQLSAERKKGILCRKDATAIAERDQIRQLLDRGGQIQHALKLDVLFDIRFLAKLAIAFGHKLFGEDYGALHYTDQLRTLLWTRRANLDPEQHRIKMRSYFNGLQDHSMKPFCFPLGFVFIFKYVNGDLVLAIVFPSGHFVQVSITDRNTDPDFKISAYSFEEHVIIAVPQLGETVGPIKLNEYVPWILGSYPIAELDAIRTRITPRTALPPLR